MGNCFSRCFGGREARRFVRNMYKDHASSVEFESLMDEMPRDEPLSKSFITEFEKHLVSTGQFDVLVQLQNESDSKLFAEMARHEEMLELEEEAFIDARQEAARVSHLASSKQIINPVRLLLKSTCSFDPRFKDEDIDWNMKDYSNNAESSNFLRARAALNRSFVPDSRSRAESTSSNGNGSFRDHGVNSTSQSSVDLEWEHEAGFYASRYSQKTEDDITTTGGSDKCGTPPSTDLEWDDGFESPEIDVIDLETEQLINEIEQLTNEALRDTGDLTR